MTEPSQSHSSRILTQAKQLAIVLTAVVGFVVAVFATAKMIRLPTRAFLPSLEALDPNPRLLFVSVLILIAIAIVETAMKFSRRSSLAFAGWPGLLPGLRGFASGGTLGLAMASTMLLLTIVSGGGHLTFEGGGVRGFLLHVIPLIGLLLIAALWEEWFFRGYPMAKIASKFGPLWANISIAVAFSLAHAAEAGFHGLIACNIVLGSMVVGALRFSKGGIPAAWGFHFAWNGLQGALGSTLSGVDFGSPPVHFVSEGPSWASGGPFGPEGGVGATIATIAVLLLLAAHARRRRIDLGLPFLLRTELPDRSEPRS